jgi:hypothetical protein
VIDGLADFVRAGVNDEEQSIAVVQFAIRLADEFSCPVMLVIHLNENAGKNGDTMPRGHLGREAVRKGYAQLNIVRDGDVSVLQTLRARKAGNEDTPLVCFRYCREKGYHVSVDANEVKEQKADKRNDIRMIKWRSMAEKVFAPPTSLSYSEACERLARHTRTQAENGWKLLRNLITHEMIEQGADGNYRLNGKGG